MFDRSVTILKAIQDDLPLTPHPFKKIAEDLGQSDKDLLSNIVFLKERGLIRRYGAVVRHRDAGFMFNAMVVFNIPDDKVDNAGQQMAEKAYISHCYERGRVEGWPYNFYMMLHAKNEEQGLAYLEECRSILGSHDCVVLRSVKEYKKTSLQVFDETEPCGFKPEGS